MESKLFNLSGNKHRINYFIGKTALQNFWRNVCVIVNQLALVTLNKDISAHNLISSASCIIPKASVDTKRNNQFNKKSFLAKMLQKLMQ